MSPSTPPNSPEESFYNTCVILLTIIALPTYLIGRFLQAPYGRHTRTGWGPTLPSWRSWFLMESPSVFSTLLIYSLGRNAASPKPLSLLAVFLLHYLHRTFIYPLRLRTTAVAPFPVSILLIGFSFNFLNSYVQARWISHYGDYSDDRWFWWRFGLGAVVFAVGMVMNVTADAVLVGLKKKGEGYKVPEGGVFEWVSCGNYLGEMVEWFGWGIMTWSWAGFGFFFYTSAYLLPRARASHKWYLDKFKEDYPKHRKAVIPFLY
ncbi:hypothetical protein RND81_13G091000 [Saponaria officinalis]|uniref:Steroid 5-alpha-reductase DET2 n=1 Tax=Saponaria officinalis TaxID=3572 RepID=A0AAW1H1Z5_SAPOF